MAFMTNYLHTDFYVALMNVNVNVDVDVDVEMKK